MTTPKEALERARTAINAIVLSTHSVSFKADLDAIDSALASLQGEDAVERVALAEMVFKAIKTSDISDQDMRDLLSCKDIVSGRTMLKRLVRAAIRSNGRGA